MVVPLIAVRRGNPKEERLRITEKFNARCPDVGMSQGEKSDTGIPLLFQHGLNVFGKLPMQQNRNRRFLLVRLFIVECHSPYKERRIKREQSQKSLFVTLVGEHLFNDLFSQF